MMYYLVPESKCKVGGDKGCWLGVKPMIQNWIKDGWLHIQMYRQKVNVQSIEGLNCFLCMQPSFGISPVF